MLQSRGRFSCVHECAFGHPIVIVFALHHFTLDSSDMVSLVFRSCIKRCSFRSTVVHVFCAVMS